MISFPDNVLRFVLSVVLRPFALTAVLATGFGTAVRVLTVVCFVLILQALLLAALPEIGGGRWAGLQERLADFVPLVATLSPVALSIALVLVAHALLLACQVSYQKLLGRLIARAGTSLSREMDFVGKNDVQARHLVSTAVVNAIRVLEVGLFMALIFALISLFDFRIALVLGIGCASALVIIVLTRKSGVVQAKEVGELRKAHIRSRERDAPDVQAHLNAEENLRYRKGVAPGWDSATLGVVVSAVMVMLLAFDVDVSAHAVHAFFLVFAMRFAVAYTRDLAKALSALFDLRVNPILRSISVPRRLKSGRYGGRVGRSHN